MCRQNANGWWYVTVIGDRGIIRRSLMEMADDKWLRAFEKTSHENSSTINLPVPTQLGYITVDNIKELTIVLKALDGNRQIRLGVACSVQGGGVIADSELLFSQSGNHIVSSIQRDGACCNHGSGWRT